MTQLVRYTSDTGSEIRLSPQIVREQLVRGQGNVSDQEIVYFMALCKAQGLNPFIKDAYLIKYGDRSPAQVITSKTVFERRADQNEQFDGMQSGVTFVNSAGAVERRDGTLIVEGEKLVGGWARIYRKDRTYPTYKEVALNEYIGRKSDGTINNMWSTKPGTMIAKVAESQALRLAFPQSFQGLYTSEEMDQAAPDREPMPVIDASAEPVMETPEPKHDLGVLTDLKARLSAATGQTLDDAGRDIMALAVTSIQKMTPGEYETFVAKADEYVKQAEYTGGDDEEIPY